MVFRYFVAPFRKKHSRSIIERQCLSGFCDMVCPMARNLVLPMLFEGWKVTKGCQGHGLGLCSIQAIHQNGSKKNWSSPPPGFVTSRKGGGTIFLVPRGGDIKSIPPDPPPSTTMTPPFIVARVCQSSMICAVPGLCPLRPKGGGGPSIHHKKCLMNH